MSTFQAVIFGIIHGFTEFLPLGSGAHQILVPYLIGWPTPEGAFAGALALGAFLALLIYFRHDWASIISSFLQVIIFRKRPMTLDERLPLFILLATLPATIAWYYLHKSAHAQFATPLWTAGTLAVFALPLWFSEYMSRKNKKMLDWNWLDSLLVGLHQTLIIIPGCGRTTSALMGAFFRNYNREAAAKFTFYTAAPFLAASAFYNLRSVNFHAELPGNLSWFTFAVAVVVTLLAGLLAIGGFMKQIQRKGVGQYALYRCLLALVVVAVYWIRSRH